jgi:hypothetical protein
MFPLLWLWIGTQFVSWPRFVGVVAVLEGLIVLGFLRRLFVSIDDSGVRFCNGLRTQFIPLTSVLGFESVEHPILSGRFATNVRGRGVEPSTWLLVVVLKHSELRIDLLGTAETLHGKKEREFYNACTQLSSLSTRYRHIGIFKSIWRTRHPLIDSARPGA